MNGSKCVMAALYYECPISAIVLRIKGFLITQIRTFGIVCAWAQIALRTAFAFGYDVSMPYR